MYTVYKCHFRFHFSICHTSLPLRLLHCWLRTDKYCNDLQGKFAFSFSGLKGGWRVPYECLGRLASIQNTIPKTSWHQCSFWEETAHYFGVGIGWLWFWPPVFWAELVQHFFLVRPDNKLDEQTSQKLPKVVVWGSAKTCRNSPRPGEITTNPILKTLNFVDPPIFWNILSMGKHIFMEVNLKGKPWVSIMDEHGIYDEKSDPLLLNFDDSTISFFHETIGSQNVALRKWQNT